MLAGVLECMTAPSFSTRGCSRYVESEPITVVATGIGLIKSGYALVFNSVGAPGEVAGLAIHQLDGIVADLTYLRCKIEIDNVTLFDDHIYFLFMGYHGYNFHNLFATCDMQSGNDNKSSFKVLIPYEIMYRFTFYTTNATGNTLYINLFTRHGV
jgi:hypothetical protein